MMNPYAVSMFRCVTKKQELLTLYHVPRFPAPVLSSGLPCGRRTLDPAWSFERELILSSPMQYSSDSTESLCLLWLSGAVRVPMPGVLCPGGIQSPGVSAARGSAPQEQHTLGEL